MRYAMKKFSNFYIFSFASIMVIVVAAVLSVAALILQPLQERNVAIEKMRNILSSIHVESTAADAQEKYNRYIVETFVINSEGEKLEGFDAFTIDMRVEMRKPLEERHLPVFVGMKDDGRKIIVPLHGKGLWGPIYGYLAMEQDRKTIYGVNFGHDKETPGLGAEISESWFQEPFAGKTIFDETGRFTSIEVERGGAEPGDPHAVDAISGGTITSKGLEAMLYDCLLSYESYFKKEGN